MFCNCKQNSVPNNTFNFFFKKVNGKFGINGKIVSSLHSKKYLTTCVSQYYIQNTSRTVFPMENRVLRARCTDIKRTEILEIESPRNVAGAFLLNIYFKWNQGIA